VRYIVRSFGSVFISAAFLCWGSLPALSHPLSAAVQGASSFREQSAEHDMAGAKSFLYVGDEALNAIYAYESRPSGEVLQYTLSSGIAQPRLMKIGNHGDLFVANYGATDILRFHGNSPPIVYDDSAGDPVDVAMCPDGTLYVADFVTAGGTGDVRVYDPGRIKSTRVLSFDGMWFPTAVSCDEHSNVYVGTQPQIFKYAKNGRGGGRELPMRIGGLGGLVLSRSGDIVVTDYYSIQGGFQGDIEFYHQNDAAPYKEILIPGTNQNGEGLALTSSDKDVWVAVGSVASYEFSVSSGDLEYTIPAPTGASFWGIAAEPENL
jgi:hypothetical protein